MRYQIKYGKEADSVAHAADPDSAICMAMGLERDDFPATITDTQTNQALSIDDFAHANGIKFIVASEDEDDS